MRGDVVNVVVVGMGFGGDTKAGMIRKFRKILQIRQIRTWVFVNLANLWIGRQCIAAIRNWPAAAILAGLAVRSRKWRRWRRWRRGEKGFRRHMGIVVGVVVVVFVGTDLLDKYKFIMCEKCSEGFCAEFTRFAFCERAQHFAPHQL